MALRSQLVDDVAFVAILKISFLFLGGDGIGQMI